MNELKLMTSFQGCVIDEGMTGRLVIVEEFTFVKSREKLTQKCMLNGFACLF